MKRDKYREQYLIVANKSIGMKSYIEAKAYNKQEKLHKGPQKEVASNFFKNIIGGFNTAHISDNKLLHITLLCKELEESPTYDSRTFPRASNKIYYQTKFT